MRAVQELNGSLMREQMKSASIHSHKALFSCCSLEMAIKQLFLFPTGLYGSIRDDYCSLLAFSITLGFIIALEFSLGVSAFALAQQDKLANSIGKKMEDSLSVYNETGNEGVSQGENLHKPNELLTQMKKGFLQLTKVSLRAAKFN